MKPSQWLIPRLGVNIDHFATLRQLRGTPYPDLVDVAHRVESAGAHQITVHLREDRRHIQDRDVIELRKKIGISLNLEMSVAPEIVRFARKVKPDWVCLVPEKRQEVTTEGGLDVLRMRKKLAPLIRGFQDLGIKVSLFIEPDSEVVRICQDLSADAIEIHTGSFCNAAQKRFGSKSASIEKKELKRIEAAAIFGQKLGIHIHAGHGFDLSNVRKVAAMGRIEEYNIGHSIVCRASLVGVDQAVREMISAIQAP
jgi:pyridoxine 5-phosphate synthase